MLCDPRCCCCFYCFYCLFFLFSFCFVGVCLIVFVCLGELANALHHTSHLTRYLSHHGTYHQPTFPIPLAFAFPFTEFSSSLQIHLALHHPFLG
ncbi:hypothetical protein GE21DRAFT_1096642 [Neurospora crassa]|nr:hypothetical protein GE21DRAFT_1096642 [Neurospora crassa]